MVNRAAAPGITQRAPIKPNECNDTRDSLAKSLYNNLFCWLVQRMNLTILPKFILEGEEDQWNDKTKTIGLLDIFGFEKFKENFFEQLCINYTNEKLHKLYISAVFDAEKMELSNEGLHHCLDKLRYPENTGVEVIKLLDEKQKPGKNETKNGILTLVNDCSRSKPRPAFKSLMDSMLKIHKENKKLDTDFKKNKKKDRFTIIHSAKDVEYDIKSFIDKNVDEISSSLEELIEKKTSDTISNIFKIRVPQLEIDDDKP